MEFRHVCNYPDHWFVLPSLSIASANGIEPFRVQLAEASVGLNSGWQKTPLAELPLGSVTNTPGPKIHK
jgi:hypothetical protein